MAPPQRIEPPYDEPAETTLAAYHHRVDRSIAREDEKTEWGALSDLKAWEAPLPLLSQQEHYQASAFYDQIRAIQSVLRASDEGLYTFAIDGLDAIAARTLRLAKSEHYFMDEGDWDNREQDEKEEAEAKAAASAKTPKARGGKKGSKDSKRPTPKAPVKPAADKRKRKDSEADDEEEPEEQPAKKKTKKAAATSSKKTPAKKPTKKPAKKPAKSIAKKPETAKNVESSEDDSDASRETHDSSWRYRQMRSGKFQANGEPVRRSDRAMGFDPSSP